MEFVGLTRAHVASIRRTREGQEVPPVVESVVDEGDAEDEQ